MTTLKCLVVDDEAPALRVIEKYAQKIDGLEIVASCRNAMDALAVMRSQKIDLIFLDIQMPGLTGLEFVNSLKRLPVVILTTAFRDYAVEGFELGVMDYLVKPISFERFFQSVGRAFESFEFQVAQPTHGSGLERKSYFQELHRYEDMYIYVRVDKKMQKVGLKEIKYIESLGDYVKIYAGDNCIVTFLKIGYLEKKLSSHKFLRIHRGFIVAKDHIDAFSAKFVEVSGRQLPIGGSFSEQVHAVLQEYTP